MPKINKLHFNGVDYDIGDKNIHDLTEKTTLSPEDELIVSDSDNVWNNKKVKASNVGKNIIGNGIVGEQVNKGDSLYYSDNIGFKEITNQQNLGDTTANSKIAIKSICSGSGDSINLGIVPTTNSTGNLSIRIETDNNGKPSGNLIDNNAYAEISISSVDYDIEYIGGNATGQPQFDFDPTGTKAIGGLFMSKDGINFYLNTSDGIITKYILSTPFDITTAQLDSISNINFGHLCCITFNSDGTRLFAIKYVSKNDTDGQTVLQYELGTPRDITTVGNMTRVTPPSNVYWTYSMAFSQDGKKFYLGCSRDYRFRQNETRTYSYNVGTARDLTTLIYLSYTDNFGPVVYINDNGTQAISYQSTYNYGVLNMATPYDINTATLITSSNQQPLQLMTAQGQHTYGGYPAASTSYKLMHTTIPFNYSMKENKIQLHGNINYNGKIRIVLQSDIDNTNYWKIGYSTQQTNLRNIAIYDGTDWTETNNTGYVSGNIIANKVLLLSSATSENTIYNYPIIANQDGDIGQKIRYIFEGIAPISDTLELGLDYYIGDNNGKITTEPGTIKYRIGFAVDEHNLCIDDNIDGILLKKITGSSTFTNISIPRYTKKICILNNTNEGNYSGVMTVDMTSIGMGIYDNNNNNQGFATYYDTRSTWTLTDGVLSATGSIGNYEVYFYA